MITVAGATLKIIQGDITEQAVDAIVNAAKNHFWMEAGVAGAITRKGGERIEQAAGMDQDLRIDVDKVSATTRNSLLLATEHDLSGIAFPAIGTGVGGLSLEPCARAMIDATEKILVKSTT